MNSCSVSAHSVRIWIVPCILILLASCQTLLAQQFVENMRIETAGAFEDLKAYEPFKQSALRQRSSNYGIAGEKQFLSLSLDFNREILSKRPEVIEIILPLMSKKNLTLKLQETQILADGFMLTNSSDEIITPEAQGKFYWGYVDGHPESAVVMNIFKDEISGTINIGEKSYTLAKIHNERDYIIYEEKDIINPPATGCFTQQLKEQVKQNHTQQQTRSAASPDNNILMYIEIDHDLFLAKGSSISATYNYFAGAFSQVIALYANEMISISLNQVKIWDTVDPYNGPSTLDFLLQFRGEIGDGFNGSLAHLVGNSGGGGIAYTNVLCFKEYGHGYSGIYSNYDFAPSYSWTVNVLTHEIGHNLGSLHTHDCVWNGNNTQIDDCGNQYTNEQTDCYDTLTTTPILPAKGTVMSYCHLYGNIGMDFNLGFGPQPGDLIRDRVYNASCLSSAEGCTLTTISVTVDGYPDETSWEIKTSVGNTIATGGAYSADNSPQLREVCLVDGCYEFVIKDVFGDGICCDEGNGSYSVSDADGNVLASGGMFTAEEGTSFCYPIECEDLDGDEICDNVDPCYDPIDMQLGEVLISGTYNARGEIIFSAGTTISENAIIYFNSPSIKFMANTTIPASAVISFSDTPCQN